MKFAHLLVATLAAAFTLAHADGATFITAGPALSNSDPVKLAVQQRTGFVKLHAVTIHRNAFGANILTVDLAGKHYTFIGSMQPKLLGAPEYQNWGGAHAGGLLKRGGATLVLLRNVKTGDILGVLTTPDRIFDITASNGHSFVVEKDPSKSLPMLTMPPSRELRLSPTQQPPPASFPVADVARQRADASSSDDGSRGLPAGAGRSAP